MISLSLSSGARLGKHNNLVIQESRETFNLGSFHTFRDSKSDLLLYLSRASFTFGGLDRCDYISIGCKKLTFLILFRHHSLKEQPFFPNLVAIEDVSLVRLNAVLNLFSAYLRVS